MKKINIIKKNTEYSKLINKGKFLKNKYYLLYYNNSKHNHNRYGISVPTKIINAVGRNKIKRQIKSIIDNNNLSIKKEKDYVIIIRKDLLELNYQQMEKKLIDLFERTGETYEKK